MHVARNVALFTGRLLAAAAVAVITLACGVGCGWLLVRAPSLGLGLLALVAGLVVALIVHELGHAGAARLTGQQVRAIYLGAPPALWTVRLGSVRVGLGVRLRGRVVTAGGPLGGRAIMIAAGPLANLVTAPVLAVLAGPPWLSRSLGLMAAYRGLVNLVPFRIRAGRRSDGAALLRLLRLRRPQADLALLMASPDWMSRPDAADRFLGAYRAGAPGAAGNFPTLAHVLRLAGRFQDLLELHAIALRLDDAPDDYLPLAVHQLEWEALCWPGLPPAEVGVAARRLEWVLRHSPDPPPPGTRHTLALARLRQGRAAEVEALCAADLRGDLTPDQRATVLATIAMARHALGQDGSELLREATALDPGADLVAEAAAIIPAGSP